MLKRETSFSAIADKPPDVCARHAVLSRAARWWMAAIFWPDFPTFISSLPFGSPNEGDPSSYQVHIWHEKTRMAGLQSGEGRMLIDSVVWAQCIYVTDTQTATSP